MSEQDVGSKRKTETVPPSPKSDTSSVPKTPRRRVGWLRRQFEDIVFVARRDKKWWLLPLFIVLLLLSAILVAASAAGPLAPFVYPFL